MKLLHFVPAYRQSVRVQLVYDALATFAECDRLGDQYGFHFVDLQPVDRARNAAVRAALAGGCDLLFMQDSDVHGSIGAPVLRFLRETLLDNEAAIAGAAVRTRSGRLTLNCNPVRPGQAYEGDVGTGLMLIDLRRLRDLPLPWFRYRVSDDGTECVEGEDIAFCRKVREQGHRVFVDARIPTTHVGDAHLDFPGGHS